jgi:hypothetical protein
MSEDVAAIKGAIEDIKEKLKKIENKKGSVRDSIYKKVKEDYEKKLKELNGQLVGKKELLKESLKEIAGKRKPLKSKLDDLQEKLEEIELRHSIGEYTDEQCESMSQEIKEKMELIEGDLDNIRKEEKETKELLGEGAVDLEELEEEEIEEKEEKKEKEEIEEIEGEPLPEVSGEDKIAEELFTGEEMTAEENESVLSNVSSAIEEKDANFESGEELFDFSEEEVGSTDNKATEKHSTGASGEDWLSSLEQELNETTEKEDSKITKKEEKGQKEEKKDKVDELVCLCPKCNYKNRPDAWYCENCGSELSSPE